MPRPPTQRSTRPDEPDDRGRPAPWWRRPTGARPVHCAASGPVGRCCTFDRDPLSEDPRDHAETPQRSTALKSSHVQTGPLCTWERITVTSTIRENLGITRKTHRRPTRALLSHVQYPCDRPEQTSRAALPQGHTTSPRLAREEPGPPSGNTTRDPEAVCVEQTRNRVSRAQHAPRPL